MIRLLYFRYVGAICWFTTTLLGGTAPKTNNLAKTQLFAAIRAGSVAAIRSALINGADPNSLDVDGTPALMQAVVYDDADAVRVLLEKGADPNRRTDDGASALLWAAGDFDKVKALVEKGANVNAASESGRTALLAAVAQRNSYPIAKYLLDHAADPNALDGTEEFSTHGKGNTSLMLAARSRDTRTVELLIARGVNVKARNSAGATALTEAISARHEAAVKKLIAAGASVNEPFGPIGMTPLIWAAFQESPEIVQILIDAGANVNAQDQLGSTPLVWAALSERDDVGTVSALLRAGAKTEVKTVMGETPLTWAKRRGDTAVVRLLEGKQGETNAK